MRFALPLLVLVLGCAGPPRGSSDDPQLAGVPALTELGPLATDFDVEHYRLDLSLDPETRRLEGECSVRLFPLVDRLRTVSLDLVGLEVSSVTGPGGQDLEFAHFEGRLRIELGAPAPRGRPLELTVRYGGTPRVGLFFVGGDPATHVFTQGCCDDARGWFPCQDHPADRATSELWIDLPEDWTAVAAGEQVEARTLNGRRREGWRMHSPHPTYLTSLVAGELISATGEWQGVPLSFHAPLAFEGRLLENLGATDEALDFLSRLTGRRYPYSKYSTSCVEDFPFGGMENVSATTLGVIALRDEAGRADRTADGLIVHEAAHQWFGDLLTCADWSEIWLNEGFATYCTGLWLEENSGAEDLQLWMDDTIEAYVSGHAAHPRPLVHARCREPLDLFFTGHVYAGGASRLHLLRYVLGDEAFYAGIRRYVGENAGRSVTSADLQGAMERASGEDLARFFEEWIQQPGHPELEVSWVYDAERDRVLLTINQVQALEGGVPEEFSFPVEVEIGTTAGVERHRLELEQRRQLVELDVLEAPQWVLLDPDRWVPATIRERKELDEWIAIARGAGPVARRRAVRELGRQTYVSEGEQREILLELLIERLATDVRGEVRAAAAQSVGEVGGPAARAALVSAARHDVATPVRIEALRSLVAVGEDPQLAVLGRELVEAAPSWGVVAQAARLVESADPAGAEAWLRRRLEQATPSLLGQPHASLLPALVEAVGARSALVLEQLAADPTTPGPLRLVATRELGRLAAQDPALIPALGGLLTADQGRVRSAAVMALAEVDDDGARQLLAAYYSRATSASERRSIEAAFGL